jgi:5,10-methylenetetrahydromethanopterin reductase
LVAVSVAVQTDKTAADYARFAAQAEAAGFDAVSAFADLGFQPPIFALLEMARLTTRVRLGPACLNPSLLHPVEIAGQAAALQSASHGRAYLGIARGSWLERVGGVADRPLLRLTEAIEVITRLLRGDDRGFTGEVFTLAEGTRLRYALPSPPPLLVGTWGRRGLALAARVADEVKLGGCANPDMVRLARSRLDDACRAAGRDPASVGLVAGAVTVVDSDATAARRLARTEVAMYLDVVGALDETVQVPDSVLGPLRAALAAGEDAGRHVPDELLHRFALAGNAAQVAAHAAELAQAGASRIEFGTPHGLCSETGVEQLGRGVLPALKALR